MKITKTQLKRLIKEELEATLSEVGYGEQGLGRQAAPEPEIGCEEIRQDYNELASQTTYGVSGEQAQAAQGRLIDKHRKCFTEEEIASMRRFPSHTIQGTQE